MTFYGRKDEIKILTQENWRDHGELVVVYGRRRIGKTTLIEHAYQNEIIWKFEGLEKASDKQQLLNFISQLELQTGYKPKSNHPISNWHDAFHALARQIKNKKVIVFFDEFQWLANMKSYLVSLFKYFWDNHYSRNKNVRFVICGSISSFIVKKVLYSKALYGRIDKEIKLNPLQPSESALFLRNRSPSEILKTLMTVGGVPKYLLELDPKQSYLQNINERFFRQNGFFFQEFQRIFISHFSSTPYYKKIISELSCQKKNIDELAKACKTKKGGSFSEILNDLVLAGFIAKEVPIDKPPQSKIVRFKLLDEYLNFYSQFVTPNIESILQGQFSFQTLSNAKLQQWQGYAFERFCRKHAHLIAKALGFSGIDYHSGSWFRSNIKEKTQIDLLFNRGDKMLTLCEIKYTSRLNCKSLLDQSKRSKALLQTHYPSHGIQTALILGHKISLPPNLTPVFDHILFAEDIFIPKNGS
jgi:AAA+ ATPase superfamily predicted ATPase